MRSAGELARATSEAAINYNHARSLALDNSAKTVSTYFGNLRTNYDMRAELRGRRMSQEDFARLAQSAMPRRLSPGELDPITGRISWPMMLRDEDFTPYRTHLDKAFADRANNGSLTTRAYLGTLQLISGMTEQLKDSILDIPTVDYISAKRFLSSLAFEAKIPPQSIARLGMAQ